MLWRTLADQGCRFRVRVRVAVLIFFWEGPDLRQGAAGWGECSM